ncbi:hypothetical protein SAMN04487965_3532 [Microbulbifer donghaiensis]|uniref:Uncharacterized protein n=1 Tax=Microbulbifer donghaiensis TaxID=494016 RepID=A0A1M5HXR5_9GAMM|nr:hypothetical protein [Microbulbifer donghaiensis]SHG20784.1 hypothetical protein SAMN04487965_3532 [Microbulbifer donghaiensis]
MKPYICFISCCAVVFSVNASPPERSGRISCEKPTYQAQCKLAWNFSETNKAYFIPQVFDVSEESWRNIEKPAIENYGVTKRTVEGGSLYRVLACDTPQVTDSCLDSGVYWVIARPKIGDLPESVADKRGNNMLIMKNADSKTQIDQYNVYVMINVLEQIDLSKLPPMVEPVATAREDFAEQHVNEDDEIQGSLYYNYTALREKALKK